MKFSEQWLREWVNPTVTTQQLAHQLTMAGLEVDAIEPVAEIFDGVVVGEVLSIEPHPEADKLQICQVDVAQPGTQKAALTIVCGARNVHAGMKAPVAVVGATLPGGMVIKKAKLRGVESFGMLCSAKELGLAESAEGLMVISPEADTGKDIRDYLQLDDVSIELGLTPNRSDCLSVAGVAREVAVLNRIALNEPVINAVPAVSADTFNIEVTAPGSCPRYCGRIITGINPQADTPVWMQERLRRSGLRSISAVVDVTNYVMLELGQPMHAFDLDKLDGGIAVRDAVDGETLRLLDGQQIRLTKDSLVIADHSKAIALAGVMGGLDSAVSDATSSLFLESAFFAPESIAGKARSYNLHTDSSHRFERGVDPALAAKAIERATALLVEIVGGTAGPVIEIASQQHLPVHQAITLRTGQIQRVLGVAIAAEEIVEILVRLGFEVSTRDPESYLVTAPSFRFDISREVDLIEEIARCYGYDRIPAVSPLAHLEVARRNEAASTKQYISQCLVQRGYQEAITYSFVEAGLQGLLDPESEAIALANPISNDMAVMRTSLWPGLIQSLLYNQNRQQKRIRLFESGVRFIKQDNEIKEEFTVSGVVSGATYPEQWGVSERPADFFDLKSDVEAMLAISATQDDYAFVPGTHPALHPGQSAGITGPEGDNIGNLGVIHPSIAQQLDLDGNTLLFELQGSVLARTRLPRFYEPSKFPAIRRDIAIIVDEAVTSSLVRECINQAAGELLRELQLFDVYHGKGVDSGRKSLALGLTLQDFSRTLTDEEIDTLMQRVIDQLDKNLNATLRE